MASESNRRADETAGILREQRGNVAVLTLCNPGRRNAFTPAMRETLCDAIQGLQDRDIRAIVITGAHGHFCTGADVNERSMDPGELDAFSLRERMRTAQLLVRAIADSSRPIVAAVEGDAFGAGLSIALTCDQIVATPDSRFGAGFARLGLLPDLGQLSTLPLRVGSSRARGMMIFGQILSGSQALDAGLADTLAPTGGAIEAAVDLASRVSTAAPLAVAMIRRALANGIPTFDDALAIEVDMLPVMRASMDFAEGVTAFREKRPARFQGC